MENKMKFKLLERSINSNDIIIVKTFFLLKTKPKTPIKNNKIVTNNK